MLKEVEEDEDDEEDGDGSEGSSSLGVGVDRAVENVRAGVVLWRMVRDKNAFTFGIVCCLVCTIL